MGSGLINEQYKKPLIIAAVIIAGLLAYGVLTMKDNRDISERVSDAVREMEDRTPGQKLGDAVKDAGDKVGDKIKENTEPSTTR
jgi:archaellum component FlaG (FlaF/FlaG flagellin family)